MYIHSVKLKNYKSIGETLNEIIIEPDITAIIGKNESGKSNVLEGLSQIKFLNYMQNTFNSENVNRILGTEAEIEYEIVLRPNFEDKKLGIVDDSKITINKESYIATGGICDYFNVCMKQEVDSLIGILGQNPFKLRDKEFETYRNYISCLQNDDTLDFRKINNCFDFFENRVQKADADKREGIEEKIHILQGKWILVATRFPAIFYRKSSKVLKPIYKLDEVQKELASPQSYPDSLLYDFVYLIGISHQDFINAVKSSQTGSVLTLRDRIKRAVNTNINEKFKDFYHVEKISLNVNFDSNILSFSVRSNDGEMLSLNERSNGLRWYLNTFIDALAHGVSGYNVVYMFDEPGISLHVNAQKELLKLFGDLSNKGNQIIYTTHSPYMLNIESNGIHRIRSVVKNDEGYTYIYKNAYDGRISPDNQQDTLAPIINAIGMNLQDTFGPAKDKLNVVCEGVSDYIYFHTMAKTLSVDISGLNIIPSFGVTNSINICNILNGWGCDFVAIFDFDKEGVEKGGMKMEKSFLYERNRHFLYLIDIEKEDIDAKKYNIQPYMMEDFVGREFLDDFIKNHNLPEDAANSSKTLLAKMVCEEIENDVIEITKECKNNFESLFNKLIDCRK